MTDPGGIIGLRDVYEMLVRMDAKLDAQAVTQAQHEIRISTLEAASAQQAARRWQVWLAVIVGALGLVAGGASTLLGLQR